MPPAILVLNAGSSSQCSRNEVRGQAAAETPEREKPMPARQRVRRANIKKAQIARHAVD
jgi:hypothetical protein